MFKFCPFCGAENSDTSEGGFKCTSCSKHVYYSSKPTAAIVPIYKGEMLLNTRKFEPYKGYLDTIGGFLEKGEHPIDGAQREWKEETGLDLDKEKLEFLGIVMNEYPYEGVIYNNLNIIYTLDLDRKINPKPQDDVKDFVWLTINGDLGGYKAYEGYLEKVIELLKEKYL